MDPDPCKIMTDPDPGGPKTYGSVAVTMLRTHSQSNTEVVTTNNKQ